MKRKWQIMVALVLSLVTMMTVAVPVLAQDEKPEEAVENSSKGALAIIAPWSVAVGKEFTVRTFLRENQEPLPDVGVWAVSADSAETLKEALSQLREDSNQTKAESDYERIIGNHGIFLGRTGRDGRLAYTFKQAGKYRLVAAKNGYLPGFTHIGIREPINALGIRVQKRAPVGEQLSMVVFERVTQNTVEGAGVWAVTRNSIEALKQEAQALRENTGISAEEKDYEALVKNHGLFLGRSDKEGKLDYSFKEAGSYLLVAVKKGYFPGFAPLAVSDKLKALEIKATPPRTQVGKEVKLRVSDRQSHDPVEAAGVWAMSRDKAEALKKELVPLRGDNVTTAAEKDFESVISARGTFLGRTDADGKLSATFDSPGTYVLVTAKKGYIPGFTTLLVREPPKPNTTDNASARPLKPENKEKPQLLRPRQAASSSNTSDGR